MQMYKTKKPFLDLESFLSWKSTWKKPVEQTSEAFSSSCYALSHNISLHLAIFRCFLLYLAEFATLAISFYILLVQRRCLAISLYISIFLTSSLPSSISKYISPVLVSNASHWRFRWKTHLIWKNLLPCFRRVATKQYTSSAHTCVFKHKSEHVAQSHTF